MQGFFSFLQLVWQLSRGHRLTGFLLISLFALYWYSYEQHLAVSAQLQQQQISNHELQQSWQQSEREKQTLASNLTLSEAQLARYQQELQTVYGKLHERQMQLGYYQRLMSAAGPSQYIAVADIALYPNKDQMYSLEVLLSQGKFNRYRINGKLHIRIQGELNGKVVEYDLKELLSQHYEQDSLAYRFQYFTKKQYQIRLPSDFQADKLFLQTDVYLWQKKRQTLQENYSWEALLQLAQTAIDLDNNAE